MYASHRPYRKSRPQRYQRRSTRRHVYHRRYRHIYRRAKGGGKAVVNHKSGKIRRIVARNPKAHKVAKVAMQAARGNKKHAKRIAMTLLRDPANMLHTREYFNFQGRFHASNITPPGTMVDIAGVTANWRPLQHGTQVNTPSDLGYQVYLARDTRTPDYISVSIIQNFGIDACVGPNKIKDYNALINMWLYYKLAGIKLEIRWKLPGKGLDGSNTNVNSGSHNIEPNIGWQSNVGNTYQPGMFLDRYFTWKPQTPGLPRIGSLNDSQYFRAMQQSNLFKIKTGKDNQYYKLYIRPQWLVNSLSQIQNAATTNVGDQQIKTNTWFDTQEIRDALGSYGTNTIKYMAYAPISVFRIHLPGNESFDSAVEFDFDVTIYHQFASRCAENWNPVQNNWNLVPTQPAAEPGSPTT